MIYGNLLLYIWLIFLMLLIPVLYGYSWVKKLKNYLNLSMKRLKQLLQQAIRHLLHTPEKKNGTAETVSTSSTKQSQQTTVPTSQSSGSGFTRNLFSMPPHPGELIVLFGQKDPWEVTSIIPTSSSGKLDNIYTLKSTKNGATVQRTEREIHKYYYRLTAKNTGMNDYGTNFNVGDILYDGTQEYRLDDVRYLTDRNTKLYFLHAITASLTYEVVFPGYMMAGFQKVDAVKHTPSNKPDPGEIITVIDIRPDSPTYLSVADVTKEKFNNAANPNLMSIEVTEDTLILWEELDNDQKKTTMKSVMELFSVHKIFYLRMMQMVYTINEITANGTSSKSSEKAQ